MDEIEITAHAKINLLLDVVGKRVDGYHDVRMIMQSISLADHIVLKPCQDQTKINSNWSSIPLDERNLALKAWRLMQKTYQLPGEIEIYLHKEIPVEAGLAGGSTDAAAVLKGINQLYELKLCDRELERIGVSLGADVAFCINGGTVLAQGIGELLTPLPSLPKLWLVLVKPGFGVSTAEVYQRLDVGSIREHPDIKAMVKSIREKSVSGILDNLSNVLETVTFRLHPELGKIKNELKQMGLFPLMSGSGPTVFGLAESRESVDQAALALSGRWDTIITAHTI